MSNNSFPNSDADTIQTTNETSLTAPTTVSITTTQQLTIVRDIEMKDVNSTKDDATTLSTNVNSSTTHGKNEDVYDYEHHDEDEVCSDSDSIIVQVARRRTKPLTLTAIKPQQEQYRMNRQSNNTVENNIMNNDNTTKVRDPNKPIESIFSKTTAKTGKSSKSSPSSVTFRISTCCGMIELNLIRVLSLLGMLLNIAAFIVVAIIVGNAFNLEATKETSLLIARSKFIQSYQQVECIVKLACSTGDTSLVPQYYSKQSNASAHLLELKNNMPAESLVKTKINLSSPQYVALNDQIMKLISEGNRAAANTVRKSFSYTIWDGYTTTLLSVIYDEIIRLSDEKQEYLKLSSSVNMGLVLFGVAVSVPIVLLIFAMALTTDVHIKRKLHRATMIMIVETMGSGKYNPLFRSFCEKEHCMDSFTLLDNCNSYRELCEQAHSLRMKSMNNDETYIREQTEDLERGKYEVAFKIFSDFIDPNGETPIKTTNNVHERVKSKLDEFNVGSTLDDDLFDELEKQVCESMVEHFIKFKQQVKQKRRK